MTDGIDWREALGDLPPRVRYWQCPIGGHRAGVEWVGTVARCLHPGCDRTSAVVDARRLHLVRPFPERSDFFALNRCYRQWRRHVDPHRFCVRRWVGARD